MSRFPTIAPAAPWGPQVALVLRNLVDGKVNCLGDVTLAANQSTTTVNDPRAGPESWIWPMPKTANAATELGNGTLYISGQDNGAFTITHANNGQTDRTFRYVVLG